MLTFNNVILLTEDNSWLNYGTPDRFNITYICNGGSITGPSSARPGQTVTFNTAIDSGWIIDYTVIDEVESSTNTFTMPSHDVIVYVFCKLDTDVDTVRFLFLDDSYDPTVSVPEEGWQGSWQRVSSSPNVWDYFCGAAGYWEFAYPTEGGRLRGAPDFEILGNNFDHMTMWGLFFGQAKHLVKVHYMSLHQDPYYGDRRTNMFQDCYNLHEAHLGCDSSVKFLGDNFGSLFGACYALTTVTISNTSGVLNMDSMFGSCTSLVVAPELDTSSVTAMSETFAGCSALVDVPLYDTSNVVNMGSMFQGCWSLEELPLFDTHNVTNFDHFFWSVGTWPDFPEVSHLKHIPLFDTSSATDVDMMFFGCNNVESGALALYQQMANQTNPPASHYETFADCGSRTTTGAAELAQIPSDWK